MGTVVALQIVSHLSDFSSEPNLKTVRELIYKRGYGKVDKQRIPITNNGVIEGVLGKYDILSVEDLIHEIITAGPNFKQVGHYVSLRRVGLLNCKYSLFPIPGIEFPLALQAVQPNRRMETA
jgi:hypothetical protein